MSETEGTYPSAPDVPVRNWWMLALRGAAALVFGLLVLGVPRIGLDVLRVLFGAYALAYGVLTVWAGLARRHEAPWWGSVLLGGVFSLIGAVVAFGVPGMSSLGLLMLIAGWAIATGMTELVSSLRLRTVITNEVLLGVSGGLSVIFGVILSMFPGPGALGVTLWIGMYGIVVGLLMLALAFRLRSWGREHHVLEPESA